MTLLKTRNLTKDFGGLTAVEEVDIDVQQEELISVIGPNGAGKSTLINLITGMLAPTDGDIVYDGTSITGLDPHEITQLGVGRSFQTASIFPELSVRDNVDIASFASRHGEFSVNFFRRQERYDGVSQRTMDALEAVDLVEEVDTVANSLPYGDKRRLEVAIGLATDPDLIFMDEPTAGMSPAETNMTTDLIEDMRTDWGITVVLVEHDMDIVFEVSDRIFVMNRGSLIASGSPDDIRGNPDVQAAYLGGDVA
ncbi:ABC transporter ATP-binding protein [Natrarchaeobius halalkaliphilus]|uniref:Probable branched-chain amino acid transport ATP-binding protein LivG n=1 Tax=Natrarchaeobius halalkaliphilus TaxID=1679091 RepID=A0A3N6LIQ8_9EURY|nr:ABC transporter ATP-binding protein [Natrarchaeobius halalkaliphilus]RQG87826.1 ABC transporter ATP-binding protein [Natrarchaeobius halalkaliphilus]